MAKKKHPPLPEENFKEVPYGTPKCRICRLPLEDLRLIHKLWFEENYSYKRMREFLKSRYKIGNDYTYLSNHFKKHAGIDKGKLLQTSSSNPAVIEILTSTERGLIGDSDKVNKDIEKAYTQLVRMAAGFTEKIDRLYQELDTKFKDDKELKKDLKDMGALQMLAMFAKMNRLAREQVRDISALRAPKVLVMQFLEDALDKCLSEVNDALASSFILIQGEITQLMKEHGVEGIVDNKTFTEVFRKIVMNYKDRILLLRREQLAKAAAALADLEKVV